MYNYRANYGFGIKFYIIRRKIPKNLRMCNFCSNFGRRLASLTLRNSPEITFAISGVYPNNLPKNEINSIFFAKLFGYVGIL